VIRSELFRKYENREYEKIGEYKAASRATGAKKGDPKYGYVKRAIEPLLGLTFQGVVIPTFTLEHIRVGVPGGSAFAVDPAFKEDVKRSKRALAGSLQMIDKDFEFYCDW